jgi:hypothetical protein
LDNGTQKHPDVEDCLVRLTDQFGVVIDEEAIHVEVQASPSFEIDVQTFPFVDEVLKQIFHSRGLERLGGQSTGRGWSSFSTWQRCQYLWKRKYLDQVQPSALVESPSLAIGTLIHVFLAIYYLRMIVEDYPLTPDVCRDELLKAANPEFVNEAWRVFFQYTLYYQDENIQPLAVELDLVDPRTRESCRFDLIAYFPESNAGRLAGTYILEHKSASRFDQDTLDGWGNDGEILGQVMSWKRLGLDHRYGKLRGVIINILGKQKEPKFHRTQVAPESWQIEQHKADLRRHEGFIQLAMSNGEFPRSRGNCISRYGRCQNYYECLTGEV